MTCNARMVGYQCIQPCIGCILATSIQLVIGMVTACVAVLFVFLLAVALFC